MSTSQVPYVRSTALFLTTVALFASGCASAVEPDAEPPYAARGRAFLEEGPTVGMDVDPPKNTTLVMLETKLKENEGLRSRVDTAESAVADSNRRAEEAIRASEASARRVEELEALLTRQTEENKALLDELLKARIARLRMERQVLESHYGDVSGKR